MRILFIFLMIFMLSACTTTIQISYNDTFNKKLEQEDLPPAATKASNSDKSKYCEIYKIPLFDPVPQAPVDEFSSLNEKDYKQKVNILINYIKELRVYISTVKKDLNQSYVEYVAKCN